MEEPPLVSLESARLLSSTLVHQALLLHRPIHSNLTRTSGAAAGTILFSTRLLDTTRSLLCSGSGRRAISQTEENSPTIQPTHGWNADFTSIRPCIRSGRTAPERLSPEGRATATCTCGCHAGAVRSGQLLQEAGITEEKVLEAVRSESVG